ncbi:MAG: hypothetical protein ING71_16275 [Rhodocyclaceae bacterium]|nr:hypothetical protein [Rhodocyclaceae bacterium]
MLPSDQNAGIKSDSAQVQLDVLFPHNATLLIRSGDGTNEIQVKSAGLVELPEGLYSFKCSYADGTSTTRFESLTSESPFLKLDFSRSTDRIEVTEELRARKIELPTRIHRLPASLQRGRTGRIVVLVTNSDRFSDLHADKELATKLKIRLCDSDLTDMLSEKTSLEVDFPDNTSARLERCYWLKPGCYLLRFLAANGRVLEQTIPAFDGYDTFVSLSAILRRVINQGMSFEESREVLGVEPSNTVIYALQRQEDYSLSDLKKAQHNAVQWLNRIAMPEEGAAELSKASFEATISLRDPISLIFAAAACLNLRDKQRLRAIGRGMLAKTCRRLLQCIRSYGTVTSDTVLMSQRLRASSYFGTNLRSLKEPPILSISWQWAVEASLVQPRLIPAQAPFHGIDQSSSAYGPWLAWPPAKLNVDALMGPMELPSSDSVGPLLDQLQETLKNAEVSGDSLKNVSPFARSIANSMFQSVGSVSKQLPKLARQLGITSAGLVSAAGELAGELDRLSSELSTPHQSAQNPEGARWENVNVHESGSWNYFKGDGRQPTESIKQKLTLVSEKWPSNAKSTFYNLAKKSKTELSGPIGPVRFPDDANKGRFGGKSISDGCELSAEFQGANSNSNLTNVTLTVSLPRPMQNDVFVDFWLHDTFQPNIQRVRMDGTTAKLHLAAWGGFTVGVIVQPLGVRLELDLSEAPNAPPSIRDL